MTDQKFHRTVYKVVVLSEEPVDFEDLTEIDYAIMAGGCCGKLSKESEEVLDSKQAADALKELGSDPMFFMLDDDGNNGWENHDEQ